MIQRPATTLAGSSQADKSPISAGFVQQANRVRVDAYSSRLASLLDLYGHTGAALPVSFRELVGPIPADDATHAIYPYPARLLRQIPRFFLHCSQLSSSTEAVLDPFCGSGTVLVEATLAGRPSWGVDPNPFAQLLSRAKTTFVESGRVQDAFAVVLERARHAGVKTPVPDVINPTLWWSATVLDALSAVFAVIEDANADPDTSRLLKLGLAIVAERTSLRDPRIPVPVRRADWKDYSARQSRDEVWSQLESTGSFIAGRVGRLEPTRFVHTTVMGKLSQDLTDSDFAADAPALTITSPPYGAAQKYVRSTSLAIGWAGLGKTQDLARLERMSTGREHLRTHDVAPDFLDPEVASELSRIAEISPVRSAIYAHYFHEMKQAFDALARVSKSDHALVLVTGDNMVAGHPIPTSRLLSRLAAVAGFQLKLELRDRVRGRSLLTVRAGGNPPMPHETICLMRRS